MEREKAYKDISAEYVKKVFKTSGNPKEINVKSGTTTSGENNPSNNSQKNIESVFRLFKLFLKKQNLPIKKCFLKVL